MNKNLFSNYVPIKRYFVHAAGSLPLKITWFQMILKCDSPFPPWKT
jgi:hypothetical protein